MFEIRVSVTGSGLLAAPFIDIDPVDGRARRVEGQFETLDRVVFKLPEDDKIYGWGAFVKWAGTKEFRFILPDRPGQWEGGLLQPFPIPTLDYGAGAPGKPPAGATSGAGSRLRVENRRFVDEQGNVRIWALWSDFRLLHMELEGEDVEAILDDRALTLPADRKNLIVGPRVFCSCHNLFQLYPQNYGEQRMGDALLSLSRRLKDRGFYWEVTVFTDKQLIPAFDGQRFWRFVCEVLDPEPNIAGEELVNEYPKNGINPADYGKVGTHPQSRGSGLGDSNPYGADGEAPPWEYGGYHPRRDHKWPYTVAATTNEIHDWKGGRFENIALVVGEPIGADEADQYNRRTTDADSYEKMAVDCALWSAGGVFHSVNGLSSQIYQPKQRACAEAFFRGITR